MQSIPNCDSRLQEVMFHELHHRFYNSLQIVSAAVGSLASDRRGPHDLAQLSDRIATLGELHRTLARPLADLADMLAAFSEVCSSLIRGFARGQVTLCLKTMTFPSDPMIVRGLTLILAELVTNALKHDGGSEAPIRVKAVRLPQCYRLTVANGATRHEHDVAPTPYVATRFAEAMGGSLSMVFAPEHIVCVTVPICGSVRSFHGDAS